MSYNERINNVRRQDEIPKVKIEFIEEQYLYAYFKHLMEGAQENLDYCNQILIDACKEGAFDDDHHEMIVQRFSESRWLLDDAFKLNFLHGYNLSGIRPTVRGLASLAKRIKSMIDSGELKPSRTLDCFLSTSTRENGREFQPMDDDLVSKREYDWSLAVMNRSSEVPMIKIGKTAKEFVE